MTIKENMKENIETVMESLSDKEKKVTLTLMLAVERAAIMRWFDTDVDSLERFTNLTREIGQEQIGNGGLADALKFEDAGENQLEPEQISRVKRVIDELLSEGYK